MAALPFGVDSFDASCFMYIDEIEQEDEYSGWDHTFMIQDDQSGKERIFIQDFMKLESLTITIEINKNTNCERTMAAERKWNGYLKGYDKIVNLSKGNKDVVNQLQKINHHLESQNKDNEVLTWLNEIVGLPQYYDVFIQNGFDD